MKFCEASSIFELDSVKNEAIPRDSLQKWKVARFPSKMEG
jgi:hypothetical protein